MIDLKAYLSSGFSSVKSFIKNHRYSKVVLAMLFFTIIGVLAFNLGFDATKKDKFLINFQRDLEKDNARSIVKYFSFSNQAVNLDESSIQPFLSFISANQSRKASFMSYLKSTEALHKDGMVVLKQIDSFLGKKWTIELQPVYLMLSTDFASTNIYINGSLYTTSDIDSFQQKLGPFIPGIYDFQAVLNNEYGSCKASKEIQLLEGTDSLSLSPPATKVTLKSNYPDGEVFVNSTSTGLKVSEFVNIGPVPQNDNVVVHIEKDFPWGRVVSEEKTVTDLPEIIITLAPLTEELRNTLENTYREFYESFFQALTEDDISLIKHCSKDIVENIFNKYRSSALIIKDSYDLTSIDWEQDAISVKSQEDIFTASAVINLEYNKEKNILGLPIYSRPDYLYFQTALTFDEATSSWFVSEINEIVK